MAEYYNSWDEIQELPIGGMHCNLCDSGGTLWAVYRGPDRYATYCEYHHNLYKSGWLELVQLVKEATSG